MLYKYYTFLDFDVLYVIFFKIFFRKVGINSLNFKILLPCLQKKKKKPVDFDDVLRIGDVRYDNMI